MILISFTCAFPYTIFQYLNLQYSIAHRTELQYIINTHTSLDESVTTNYGYRSTPWETGADVSSVAFIIIPALVVLLFSAWSFLFLNGSMKRRYLQATITTLILIPVTLLSELPWAWIYSGGNLYDDVTNFTIIFTFFYGLIIFFCAGIVNAILTWRFRRSSEKSDVRL